jgi:putative membrane protein
MSTRRLLAAVASISAAAIALLFWLIYGHAPEAGPAATRFAFLPGFNAVCNALATLSIIAGLLAIRAGRQRLHAGCMVAAFATSSLFLAGYILHHSLHGDTRFVTQGWLRPVYFSILVSHIVLSVVALPLVLATVASALLRRWPLHRRLAPWTWPLWLYVSSTGVLIYVFLRHLNG